MIDLKYSLVIETTDNPSYFGFYSPGLQGFTGIGHSQDDSIYQAVNGMKDFDSELKNQGMEIPKANRQPQVIIQNENFGLSI